MTAVVNLADSTFSDGVRPPQALIVTVSRNPDPRMERYSGNPANPIRAATAKEITAWDDAQRNAIATAVWNRALQALAAALYKDAHGAFPTASQLASVEADFITARKAILDNE